jgi:hypothetical protein
MAIRRVDHQRRLARSSRRPFQPLRLHRRRIHAALIRPESLGRALTGFMHGRQLVDVFRALPELLIVQKSSRAKFRRPFKDTPIYLSLL